MTSVPVHFRLHCLGVCSPSQPPAQPPRWDGVGVTVGEYVLWRAIILVTIPVFLRKTPIRWFRGCEYRIFSPPLPPFEMRPLPRVDAGRAALTGRTLRQDRGRARASWALGRCLKKRGSSSHTTSHTTDSECETTSEKCGSVFTHMLSTGTPALRVAEANDAAIDTRADE